MPLNHDISENKNASTDVLAMEVIDTKMSTKTTQSDVDRLHRVGKRKNIANPRQGIINFFWYNDSKKVFPNKKLVEDSHVSIKESLTAFRMKRLTNARETSKF